MIRLGDLSSNRLIFQLVWNYIHDGNNLLVDCQHVKVLRDLKPELEMPLFELQVSMDLPTS